MHIGKRLNEYSLISDQEYILNQIKAIAQEQNIDAMLISGDVYDKSIPPVEAVNIFDEFITFLSDNKITTYIISGNHDSPERLNFGSKIMSKNNVHIVSEIKDNIAFKSIQDSYGKINIYMLPYVKSTCAVELLEKTKLNKSERNIILAHQFVTYQGIHPEISDSESKHLGGIDNIDASLFFDFDYVALGHIHKPQRIGQDYIRYSGSPLKYSFSECKYNKEVVVIEAKEKNNLSFERIKLVPKHDLFEITCSLESLKTQNIAKDSYMHVTLTDKDEIIDAIGKVRNVFENVMLLDFENNYRANSELTETISEKDIAEKTPVEIFETFFEMQNGFEMSEEQKEFFNLIYEGVVNET